MAVLGGESGRVDVEVGIGEGTGDGEIVGEKADVRLRTRPSGEVFRISGDDHQTSAERAFIVSWGGTQYLIL